MVTAEYKIAYSEVLEILNHISKEDFNKIPKNMLEMFKANAEKHNNFVYNPKKNLNLQNISLTGKTIIAILYKNYWKKNCSNLLATIPNDNFLNKLINLFKKLFNNK